MDAYLDLEYQRLLSLDQGKSSSSLSFFMPDSTSVVVGYGNVIEKEVNVSMCASNEIPIYRRVSGGGTVLQAPGCLNYSLLLSFSDFPFLSSVSFSNAFIMNRMKEAFSPLFPGVSVDGITDLVVDGKKFSGNAQKRLRNALLFHGTFLLSMDLSLVSLYLNYPSIAPEYRKARPHIEFICNLFVEEATIKERVSAVWPTLELV